jgi:hypothetical protein
LSEKQEGKSTSEGRGDTYSCWQSRELYKYVWGSHGESGKVDASCKKAIPAQSATGRGDIRIGDKRASPTQGELSATANDEDFSYSCPRTTTYKTVVKPSRERLTRRFRGDATLRQSGTANRVGVCDDQLPGSTNLERFFDAAATSARGRPVG